ncbi:hypothetical protein [Thermogymnomonas acidicola]|nr:hypothetical protein [Thermogymnomonas acidicola]
MRKKPTESISDTDETLDCRRPLESWRKKCRATVRTIEVTNRIDAMRR